MGKHFVPQEYLRGFSATADRRAVWMFDKLTGDWSNPAISKAAQSPDYYPSEVERRLADEVEAGGHSALNLLRAGRSLDEQGRSSLSYYLAVLIMRGPRKRRIARALAPDALSRAIARTESALEELRSGENTTRIDQLLVEVSRIELSYRREYGSTMEEEIDNPWPSAQVLAAIEYMTWRILDVPHDRFLVTSDGPAHYLEALGLGSDETELTFPIDSRSVLIGSYSGDPKATVRLYCKAELVKEVNRRMASGAERFVFSPHRADWIETLALNPRPLVRRLIW
jgi:hypothetical protein